MMGRTTAGSGQFSYAHLLPSIYTQALYQDLRDELQAAAGLFVSLPKETHGHIFFLCFSLYDLSVFLAY